MTIPPLAIVQARMGSTRLPGKMLLPLAGKPLWWHAWNAAVEAFGRLNVVFAIPASAENDPLYSSILDELYEAHLDNPVAQIFSWDGPENDVLGRFYHCAHRYRWHPDTVIVRVTPDDFAKTPQCLLRVASGERLPVELGGEAFTLEMLDAAIAAHPPMVTQFSLDGWATGLVPNEKREHITHAIFPTDPPPPPPGIWTVDTPEDYEAAKARMENP